MVPLNVKCAIAPQLMTQSLSWQQVQPHALERTPDELERGVKDSSVQVTD
jgi:hypothetical protein